MPSLPQFNPLRLRSYIFRLPLATRLLVTAIVGLWIAAIPFPWLRDLGSLSPDKFDLTQSTWFPSRVYGRRRNLRRANAGKSHAFDRPSYKAAGKDFAVGGHRVDMLQYTI